MKVSAERFPVKPGDSVAVNGVCLTVRSKSNVGKKVELNFDLSGETLRKTSLKRLKPGVVLNIEPALALQGALGGHIVQGHVDGVGRVERILARGGMKEGWFSVPKDLAAYLVREGSIAVDGVSLTMARVKDHEFMAALIPHTLRRTNLDSLRGGDAVNIEADIIAKYVLKYAKRL